jgi:hypothetical protein
LRRTALPVLAAALTASLLAAAPPSAAAGPDGRGAQPTRDGQGNGPERNEVAATATGQDKVRVRGGNAARPAAGLAYPRQTTLRTYDAAAPDASRKLGLLAYADLAPRLNDLQSRSDRISVEVIGESVQGRDLYLVTVTAPESTGQAKQQEEMRRLIEEDPARAARDPRLAETYKTPFLVHGNIHGNEWEGTDGILRVVEDLALSPDPAVASYLERTRLYAVLSVNPDGRVNNTRANAAGFDMNRDYITATQPEVVATRDLIAGLNPLVMLDMHGYVGGTLIEPGTPPHGQNYEYDLYIRNALPNAEAMEAALEAATIPDARAGEVNPVIPFRDWAPGDWDDWPPIFTPMYSIFHGAVGHTIEFPLRVNNATYTDPRVGEAELQRRARVNTAVVVESLRGSMAWADANRAQLLGDQVEMFRRGLAGEPHVEPPVGTVEGFGPEDQGYTTEFPRAYVIPAVEGQRSPAAAARLVDHLVANDVRVLRAEKTVRVGDRAYPAGTYVVDMRQPKRGLANVMLEAGRDISDRVPQMYDISGWSHRLLWGAGVDVVQTGAVSGQTRQVVAASPTGGVQAPAGAALQLQLTDSKDVQAANALLDDGVALTSRPDGSVVVPATARAAARQVTERFGVRFTAAPDTTGTPLAPVTVAAAAAADELKVLRDLGFDVRPVSTAVLNGGYDWSGVDVLFVSSGLTYNSLNTAARAALQQFLTTGGVVTRGFTGATFNSQAGLLTTTAVRGRTDANGVVSVVNAGGPVTAGSLPHSFVYSPLWFTGSGPEVVVEQSYATSDLLVAGHWRPNANGSGGQTAARGQASVVRGLDERGASVVLFGTEPLFRDHPKGLYADVARAVFHTSVTAGQPAVATAP